MLRIIELAWVIWKLLINQLKYHMRTSIDSQLPCSVRRLNFRKRTSNNNSSSNGWDNHKLRRKIMKKKRWFKNCRRLFDKNLVISRGETIIRQGKWYLHRILFSLIKCWKLEGLSRNYLEKRVNWVGLQVKKRDFDRGIRFVAQM